MNCHFCGAPFEEEEFKQKNCPKCKAQFFILKSENLSIQGEAIKDLDLKGFEFSLKPLETQLEKSIRGEDFLGFRITFCPFCTHPLNLAHLSEISTEEKGIILKFPQKEKKGFICSWCGKTSTQVKESSNTLDIFLPFKVKSEFEKNLEKFLNQPPISNIEEKKGCLFTLLFFPFFK